jgi:GTP-dependent phosphoenolpyruvate carboxykinase
LKKTSAKSLWLLTTNKEEVAIIITKVLAVGAVTTETEIKTIMPVQNNNQMETTETETETTVADKRAERALSKNISLKKAETTKELLQLILRNLMKRISVSRSPSISKPILALTQKLKKVLLQL